MVAEPCCVLKQQDKRRSKPLLLALQASSETANAMQSIQTYRKISKIKYIFIDEFQDINETQLQIIIELSKFCKCLFLVGDDLQNIYSFRGSSNDIILNIKTYSIISM